MLPSYISAPRETAEPTMPLALWKVPGPVQGMDVKSLNLCAGGREVVISRKAGEAVLRGAPVFVPGVLAATAGIAEGLTPHQLL